jgi:hypothetical protein
MIRRLALFVIAFVCVAATAALWHPGDGVRTEDRNGDGRPDLWRVYDSRGRLVRVAIDTNFDGRSDVDEFFERDALVRRESDRNFDDRVDLVEDFDVGTHAHVRSIEDVDNDGTADVLILYQSNRPVFRKVLDHPAAGAATRRGQPAPSWRSADALLFPLADPFRADQGVRSAGVGQDDGGTTALLVDAVPVSRARAWGTLQASSTARASKPRPVASFPGFQPSPRGPPVRPA